MALLALGFAGAMAVGTPVSTKAQGFYFGGGGVEVVTPYRDREYRRYDRYYGERSYAYDRRYNGRYYNARNGCPRNFTIQDGRCKPYRGY